MKSTLFFLSTGALIVDIIDIKKLATPSNSDPTPKTDFTPLVRAASFSLVSAALWLWVFSAFVAFDGGKVSTFPPSLEVTGGLLERWSNTDATEPKLIESETPPGVIDKPVTQREVTLTERLTTCSAKDLILDTCALPAQPLRIGGDGGYGS